MLRIVLLMLFAVPALADYEETRELAIDTDGATTLRIDAGAGSLTVTGEAGADVVTVIARIVIEGRKKDVTPEFVEKRVKLSLDRRGDNLRLASRTNQNSMWSSGTQIRIDLDVTMPDTMALRIDDGSGTMQISGVHAPVRIDDGSGSIIVSDTGALTVDDGSGSVDISSVAGHVDIKDGSGSLEVVGVTGSVRIDDGSGSITVRQVTGDLIVDEAGSGSLNFSDIQGRVEVDE